jgi:hypothetical protein
MVCDSTKGESLKKTNPKKKRLSLAKAIANESTIGRKLCVAMGRSFFGEFAPDSELNLLNLVRVVKSFKQIRDFNDKRFQTTVEQTGLMAMKAITSENHKFFSRLAVIVQYDKKPKLVKLYAHILEFCYFSKSGTEEKPCNAKMLHTELLERRHNFSGDHPNQVPRTLRAICKKLGVVLDSKGRGRPRKNLQP